MEKKFLVGFDPSFINMGVCIYSPKEKTMKMFSGDFQAATAWLGQNVDLKSIIAVVENSALDSTTFNGFAPVKKVIEDLLRSTLMKFHAKPGTKVTMADVESEFSKAMRKAQNIGQNKAAAKLLIKMLHDNRVPTIEVAPSKRQRADKKKETGELIYKNIGVLSMPTKSNYQQFKKLTGYTPQSTEHSRDAATLVHGRTIKWAELQLEIAAGKEGNRPGSYPKTTNDNYYLFSRDGAGK